jgi:hypothetical protein
MSDPNSRYANIEQALLTHPDGTAVAHLRRRLLPRGDSLPLLAEVAVEQGERLDLFAARTLGDPLQFWRICDANDAMDPQELTDEPGARLRVPLPQAG